MNLNGPALQALQSGRISAADCCLEFLPLSLAAAP
jgi:hypothetical protein